MCNNYRARFYLRAVSKPSWPEDGLKSLKAFPVTDEWIARQVKTYNEINFMYGLRTPTLNACSISRCNVHDKSWYNVYSVQNHLQQQGKFVLGGGYDNLELKGASAGQSFYDSGTQKYTMESPFLCVSWFGGLGLVFKVFGYCRRKEL